MILGGVLARVQICTDRISAVEEQLLRFRPQGTGSLVPWCSWTSQLQSLSDVLQRAEDRLTGRADPESRVWPTGFDPLDDHLTGGFRAGELVLLAGPQGLGKTTLALQVGRNIVARTGRQVVYFCFEHDPQSLLDRLVALEAGEVGGFDAPDLRRVRVAFEASDRRSVDLADRLDDTRAGPRPSSGCGTTPTDYHLHRSSGRSTSWR